MTEAKKRLFRTSPIVNLDEREISKFWSNVEKTEGCWNWTGSTEWTGYGKFKFRKTHYRAHRVAMFLFNGPIPDNLLVLHSCDNRRCCNPSHLRIGTHKENTADALKRNRGFGSNGRGRLNKGRPPLDFATVQKIRSAFGSQRQIAAEYGVSLGHVHYIRANKTRTVG